MTNSWIVVKQKPAGPVGALFFGARSKVKLISVKILGAVQGTITFYPFCFRKTPNLGKLASISSCKSCVSSLSLWNAPSAILGAVQDASWKITH
jgi:hypothetical protein